jgi:hypothetical protein
MATWKICQSQVGVVMVLGSAIHPAAQQTGQDVEDKVSPGGSESHGIEAHVRKKRPRWVLHEVSETVDGGNSLVSSGIVTQAEQHDVH